VASENIPSQPKIAAEGMICTRGCMKVINILWRSVAQSGRTG